MLSKSEIRRIEYKLHKAEEDYDRLKVFLKKTYKELLKDLKIMLDWMFYYQPKNEQDKWWHLAEVVCVVIVLRYIHLL